MNRAGPLREKLRGNSPPAPENQRLAPPPWLSGRVTFCILLKMPVMIVRRLSPVFCVVAAFALAGPASADGRRPTQGANPPRAAESSSRPQRAPAAPSRPARNDALADSVRRVHSRTGGQVLSAERVPYDGRDINRVKVVDEHGRVRVYMDDPTARPRRPPRPTRGSDD